MTEPQAERTSGEGAPGTSARGAGGRILLFEDDDTLAGLLARVLRAEGYLVDVRESAAEMPTPEELSSYSVVLSDIHLAGETNGHDVLQRIRATHPALPVVLMTAYADIEGAMKAVGMGAYDYLAKPVEPTDLKRMVGEAIARRKLAQGGDATKARASGGAVAQIIGTTPSMLTVYKTVAHVAPTTATVLIVGESGTGKELVARAIHAKSPRANKPFVPINCGALPESILESELFGHERGAFTGATATKHGVFEEARGGTLLLDEIGEIGPKMQVQLLRVLQEGEIRRVGAAETIKVDVRVVAATNRDLERAVAQGRFRSDLFHRLSQFTLHVPPLRVRQADIEPLARHFLAEHFPELELASSAMDALLGYSWPGNIRELRNAVIQAGVMSQGGAITSQDFRLRPALSPSFSPLTDAADYDEDSEDREGDSGSLEVMERRMIEEALAATGGHQQKAAARLGISRRTLSRKLKLYETGHQQRVAL